MSRRRRMWKGEPLPQTLCALIDEGRLTLAEARRVTESPHVAGAVSVTGRCRECGARLFRKLPNTMFAAGFWIQQYRKGARYCCNACRQKAYRARRPTPDGG